MSIRGPHEPGTLDQAALERAAVHALGGLDAANAHAYDKHLQLCKTCRDEVESLQRTVAELGLSTGSVAPPADLMDRLMARVRTPKAAVRTGAYEARAVTAEAAQSERSYFVLGAEGAWEPTSVSGVECRTLYLDEAGDRATMLFRMAPGTSYPAHQHNGPEECFVLEGDLRIGDVTMQKGDFQFAAAGTEHAVQSTENGCLLLISTSLSDELI